VTDARVHSAAFMGTVVTIQVVDAAPDVKSRSEPNEAADRALD